MSLDGAKCVGRTKLFFSDIKTEQEHAIALCRLCPVSAECAELGRDEEHGIWGGRPATELRKRDR